MEDDGETLDLRFVQFHTIPGAQNQFHMIHDEVSGYYWMTSNLPTKPQDERRILALFYGLDPLCWFQAGIIAMGKSLNYAFNYTTPLIDGKDLLIAGLALQYVKLQFPTGTLQDEASAWSTPTIFFAMEFDIFNWLTGRVGGSKTIASAKDVDTTDPTLPKDSILTSSYDFGLGMGLHFNNFDVDASVNPDALFSGGYFLSGDSTEPITRITGTYYW